MLEKLEANNSKLAATNKDLVVIVQNFPTRLIISNKKPPASRKRAASGNHKERGTQHCAPIVKREGIMHLMHDLNLQITRTSARPVGKAGALLYRCWWWWLWRKKMRTTRGRKKWRDIPMCWNQDIGPLLTCLVGPVGRRRIVTPDPILR